MTVEVHLSELERRHRALEREIEDAVQHPGTDDLTVSELKRRKLVLKDEIARIKHDDGAPVH